MLHIHRPEVAHMDLDYNLAQAVVEETFGYTILLEQGLYYRSLVHYEAVRTREEVLLGRLSYRHSFLLYIVLHSLL
jgi:hypothetical protein